MAGGEVRVCERRIEFFVKIQKKCEQRIKVFGKFQKKKLGEAGSGGRVRGGGGQGGCERRIKVFVKIQKKNIFFFWGGGGGSGKGGSAWWAGVRVDVNEELKFL